MKSVSILMTMALVGTAATPAFGCDKTGQASFPMPAAAFQEKVNSKATKIRARTEERLKESGATAEQAKQERARIEAALATIQAAAKKATADGTVTAEEAETVRSAWRELRNRKTDGANKG